MIKFWKFRNKFKTLKFNSKIKQVSLSTQKLWSGLTLFLRMVARKICQLKVLWPLEIDLIGFRLLTLQE